MKKIITLSILLFCSLLYSQENIEPLQTITYGNYSHTNRDFLNGTLKDSEGNIYLLGSTENDFTFSDVKIIKLDKDLNVVWEKEKSFDIGISYDGVLGAHIDSNDQLIVISRAAYTSFHQTFIVTKYDEFGEVLWEHPLSDLNNPTDMNYYTFSSFLDNSDNLDVVYQPINQNNFEFFFKRFSPSGQVLNEFSTTEPFTAENGDARRFRILKNGGLYYSISVEDLGVDPDQRFMLHKFDDSSYESFELGLDSDARSYFNSAFNQTYTYMKKDNQNNLVVLAPSPSIHEDYGVLNVNPDGTVNYILSPDDTHDKYPLEFGFDSQNNLLILSNNRLSSGSEPLKVTLQKYNQNGELIYENSVSHIGTFATMSDEKITVLTDQNKIVSYDYEMNSIDEIQLNSIDTYNFEINELISTESNYYLSGYTQDINYSGSVYLSEIDMLIKKTDNSNELNTYRFSGKGTSKIFQRKEIVARDTAYAFAVIEKLGPDNHLGGGSFSPEQQRFVTLDKQDLSILEDKIVPLNEILYTTYYPKDLTTNYAAPNGDFYEYIISSDTTSVSLHKNSVLQWSRNLDLYIDPNGDPFISDDEVIFDWKVNNKGDFYLSTYIYGLNETTLHKYSIDNDYNTLEYDEKIVSFLPYTNNWLFTMNEDGYVRIYSDRLTIINELNSPLNNVSETLFYSKEKNNQILFHKHREQMIRSFNQFGEVQSEYFEINTPVDHSSNPFTEYDDRFLLVMEITGSSIYLSPEYSWSRAVIKKFDLDLTHTFDEISYGDDDSDGVSNDIDECRETPTNESADIYGCSSSQTLSVDEYAQNREITLYPNPSYGQLNFDTRNVQSTIQHIEVYDYTGKRILLIDDQETINNNKIELGNQKPGVYLVRFYLNNHQFLNQKILILNR